MARLSRAALAAVAVACSGEPPGQPPDPCDTPGVVCTWMGKPGLAMLSADGLDRRKEGLYLVQDIGFSGGEAFVSDFNNHRILGVGADGTSRTVAGTGVPGDGPHEGGSCADGCEAHSTEIWHPSQVAADPADPAVLYAAAWHNHRLVRIDTRTDEIRWLVGTGEAGYSDDPPQLAFPSSVVAAADGSVYLSDQGNQVVRRVTPDGQIERVAGSPGVGGYSGDGGPAIDAVLHGHSDWIGGPTSKLALSGSTLVLADTLNGVIRAIDLDRGTIERVAGRFVPGADVGSAPGYSGDGGPALDAVFSLPRAVAVGPAGELYVADSSNHCVRVVDPDGEVRAFAGRCGEEGGFSGDGGPALDARFDLPCGLWVDGRGALYVADSNNHVVRRIAAEAEP
ncbi:MAG: hypothetical protein ABMA64_14135 [Myxococcota bacterium]